MIVKRSGLVRRMLDKVPGKSMYRFLPFFFVLGAALEFSMINWTVGQGDNQVNFCKQFFSQANFSWLKFIQLQSCSTIYQTIKGAQLCCLELANGIY